MMAVDVFIDKNGLKLWITKILTDEEIEDIWFKSYEEKEVGA